MYQQRGSDGVGVGGCGLILCPRQCLGDKNLAFIIHAMESWRKVLSKRMTQINLHFESLSHVTWTWTAGG